MEESPIKSEESEEGNEAYKADNITIQVELCSAGCENGGDGTNRDDLLDTIAPHD